MLGRKLILVLSFLCVTPLTIWESATCEDRKCRMKCSRRTARCLGSPFLHTSFAGGADPRGRGLQGSALLWFGEAGHGIFWFWVAKSQRRNETFHPKQVVFEKEKKIKEKELIFWPKANFLLVFFNQLCTPEVKISRLFRLTIFKKYGQIRSLKSELVT